MKGDAITPVIFKAAGGAADLQILPLAYDVLDRGDAENVTAFTGPPNVDDTWEPTETMDQMHLTGTLIQMLQKLKVGLQ